MISFLRRSIPNFKDAEETELAAAEAAKNKRGSSATSATSSQDEGIHSTGEKEEDDINDEDLPDNKTASEDENGNNEEEDDEGRGSFVGGKLTDDESEEPGYSGDAEDTPITSALGNNESDEETLKNEESEVDLEGTEDEVEDAPGEDATVVESENAPEDEESVKSHAEESEVDLEGMEDEIEDTPGEDATVMELENAPEDEESVKSHAEETEEEAEEPEDDVQPEPDVEDTENEVEAFTMEDNREEEETELEVEALTADEAVVKKANEEEAVEDQDTEQEATAEDEKEDEKEDEESEDKVAEYQEEDMEVDEPALEAIEEAAEPVEGMEESNPHVLEVPSISVIESEGEKSDISEEPTIAQLPGTKTRKKKEIIDMSKVTANRKPLYTRVAMPISSKKENTNFKPQLKSKTDFHRQKTFRLKRKPPNVTLNRENKENELPPLKNVYRRTSETSDAINSAGTGSSEFLNPHMDHSLKRPIAPHYRLKTSELNTRSPRLNIKGAPGTEVYVPEEEKIYVYSYSSIPRVLQAKRVNQRKFSTQFSNVSNDIDPNSSLRLKFRNARLIRGSTFGKDGMPQWDPYFAYARCLSRNDFQSILEGSEGTPSYGTTPRYRKQRASISVATQVSEGERSSQLISRSPETEVIKALVANTLREAAMEVTAEAEEDREKMESLAATRLASLGSDSPAQDAAPEDQEPMDEDVKEDECKEEEEVHIDEEAATVAAVGGDEEAEEDEGGGEDAEGEAEGEAKEEAESNDEEETGETEDAEEADGDAVTEINNATDEETEENEEEEKQEKDADDS